MALSDYSALFSNSDLMFDAIKFGVVFLMKGLKALKMLKSTITMRGHIMKRLIMKLMPAMIF